MIILVCPRILRDPIQLPEQTTTSDWSHTKNDFVSVLILQTISDCNVVVDRGEVCVIWFILGICKWTVYVIFLRLNGFTSTNFHTIINEAKAASGVT
jgi:hypothetical protein